jgi:MFS family permease
MCRPVARLVIDISPLRRVPAYRRLWAGSALSSIGSSMTVYAVPLQIFVLTRRSADVGLLGLVIAIPTVIVGLFGGVIVDIMNRRRLVLIGTTAQAVLSAILAVQAYAGWDRVWVLYVLAGSSAAIGGINAPARRTFMPALLGCEQITSGAALQMFSMHGAFSIGPALAGIITGAAGLRACYVVDACSFAFALYGIARLPDLGHPLASGRSHRSAVADSFRFIRGNRIVFGALLADTSAALLAMPVAVFPALNAERYHGDPTTLGLMTTAIAVGGILATGLSGPVHRVQRQGLGMLVCASIWGGGILGFGLTHDYPLAFASLVLAGVGDSIAVVFRTSLVQRVTPDELRGRVTGAEMAVGMGMGQLGNTRAGLVASLTSPGTAIISGGLSCIVAAALIGGSLRTLIRARVP